jgi:protein involved in polysaccharide export with SLBB domain
MFRSLRNSHFAVVASLFLLACCTTARALPAPHPANQAPSNKVAALSHYLLGPADVLTIAVEGYAQYSYAEVPVSPDGKISLPFFGTYKVTGHTVKQLQEQLTAKLRQRMRDPHLTVALLRPRPIEVYAVYVLGNGVKTPGVVQIQTNYRLTEALAKAGGLAGRPEETIATLTRGDNKPIEVDLTKLIAQPSSAANLRVKPNDVLTLTLMEPKRITIDGDLTRPGVYLMRQYPTPGAAELPLNAHLRDAIIAAGNLKSPYPRFTSDGSGTDTSPATQYTGYILRGKERIELNVDALNDFTDRAANVALEPNDYVRVQAVAPTRVVIQGNVKQNGDIFLPKGASVIDAIAAAGGLTQTTDKVAVSVSRSGKIIPVDLNRALLQNDPAANIPLINGDNILVADPATITITLSGELTRPDVVKLPPGTALLDAIAGAGGLKIDPADARINILRTGANGTQSVLHIDAVGLYRRNDLSQNVKLQDGDVINVASVHHPTVFIAGEVATSGVQLIDEGEGIAEVIARAGGPTLKAALTHVAVKRGNETLNVDAYDAVRNGKALDFKLQDGDYVVVPPIEKKVMVMEAVLHPDYYPIPERGDLTVLGAISLAGGTTNDAIVKQIVLLRPTPKGVEHHIFSLQDIQKGDWSANTVLQNGDVVYVPRRNVTPTLLNKVQSTLGTLLLVPRLLGGF